jgi:hypothetical protein
MRSKYLPCDTVRFVLLEPLARAAEIPVSTVPSVIILKLNVVINKLRAMPRGS